MFIGFFKNSSRRRGAKCLVLVTLVITVLLFTATLHVAQGSPSSVETTITEAILVSVKPPWDTIDEGIKECIIQAIDQAEDVGAAVIISVDSYGGYLDAGFAIGDRIASSRVPVISFVSGGKALSAGTLIILPSHIVAIAPHAIIGAMQPIAYDPVTGSYTYVNESKIVNPIVEKAVTYAKMRGRNTTAAELFVRKNLVLNAGDAVRNGVADVIATSINDLLSKIRNVEVNISNNVYRLRIEHVTTYGCSIRSRLISIFSSPLVSSVLLTIGIMGTIFALLSGKLPVIPVALLFLILGLLGSGFSPNLIALFMVLLGAILLAVEVFVTPGFGALGIAGIIFLALGFALIPSSPPSAISPPPNYLEQFRVFAMGIGLGLGSFTGFIIYKVIQAKRSKPVLFTAVGKVGRAIDDIEPGKEGFVMVEGEYWRAISDERIPKGAKVRVVRMDGSRLVVRRVEAERGS